MKKFIAIGVVIIAFFVVISLLYQARHKKGKHADETISKHQLQSDQQEEISEVTASSDTARRIASPIKDQKRYVTKVFSPAIGGRYKKLFKGYGFEISGKIDESLEMYQIIAESSCGSEQLGAVNRYRFALRRKYEEGEELKKEIERIKNKTDKTAFELVLIAKYKDVSGKECYRAVLTDYPESGFSEYAEINIGSYYDPSFGKVEEFRPTAIQSMKQFINDHPDSAFVPHAKLRIAARYEMKEETREEAAELYKQTLQDYPDDKLVSAHCIIGLYWLGVLKDPGLYKLAKEVGMFYGTYADGYFLRKDFDPEAADFQNHPLVKAMLRELTEEDD